MSNHDYTKYSKSKDEKVEETEEITVATEVIEETEEITAAIEEPAAFVKGKVINCMKLNVREEPSLNSKILCEISHNSEVEIDETESTDEFYKIVTVTGIEGFCKKEYITISQ